MDSTATAIDGDRAKLVFRNGPCRGKVIYLDGDRVTVGRNPRNSLVIDLGMIVSSFHASLRRETRPALDPEGPPREEWWIEDRGSKNGTYVNGERIEKVRLEEGDIIGFALTGPEVQFTHGHPELPGLFSTSMKTFRRTQSVETALRELLPSRGRGVVSMTGVQRLVDDNLERMAQRNRWLVVCSAASLLALVAVVVSVTLLSEGPPIVRDTAAPSGSARAGVALVPRLDAIYGSLFLSYRDHPIGSVQVRNESDRRQEDLELRFGFVAQPGATSPFLVEPFRVPVPPLEPGGDIDVPLRPKLSNEVLSPLTREVRAEIRLFRDGQELARSEPAIFIHGRNVFNWEKPARIAAFIDPDDPALQEFVNQIWRQRPEASGREFPPARFQDAVSLITALAGLDLRYLSDSRTPVSSRVDSKAIDRVNYPWETLTNRTGDCDDLAVLCAAVLERARIPTAMAVAPQHVLCMFDSGIAVEHLESTPLDPETIVPWRGRVWIPIETTALGKRGASFQSAWAAAWPRRSAILDDMQIVEVREGWKSYTPMNPTPDQRTFRRIDDEVWVQPSFSVEVTRSLTELRRLFLENLDGKIRELADVHASGRDRDRAVGMVFARSGLYDRACQHFARALVPKIAAGTGPAELTPEVLGTLPDDDPEVPDLLFDFGTCLTFRAGESSEFDLAILCFEEALRRIPDGDLSPDRGEFQLRLAFVHHLKGDLATAKRLASDAIGDDPVLRERYRQLVEGSGERAGENERVRRFLAEGLR